MKCAISVILLACVWFLAVPVCSNAYNGSSAYDMVYVRPGETVWNIAARYVSDNEDVRELIAAIREQNRLDGNANIYVGQALKVPLKRDAAGK